MRNVITAFVFVAACAVSAQAAPRTVHAQPTPSAEPESREATGKEDPYRAAAQVKQDAFDQRIARSSERALKSVCSGCTGQSASVQARALRRPPAAVEPEAEVDEGYVVDEAGAAPQE